VRLDIQGGTVENTSSGRTITHDSNGYVTISGGTVSSATGIAVYNSRLGRITISGTAKVTSANTNTTSVGVVSTTTGTINIDVGGTSDTIAERLQITGGTVENTSNTTGYAVYNGSTNGKINITGGTVSKSGSPEYAVYNHGAAAPANVTISGSATINGLRFN